jgi:hypothetical protein
VRFRAKGNVCQKTKNTGGYGIMAKRKWDHLFTPEPLQKSGYPPKKDMLLFVLSKGVNFQIRFTHVSVPFNGMEPPHKHDFDEVFFFVPCTDDLRAYDAETELYIEGEKYIINKCTAVHVPAGLMHCPLNHIRVGTPFFFVNCPLTPEYTVEVNGKKFTPGPPSQIKPK